MEFGNIWVETLEQRQQVPGADSGSEGKEVVVAGQQLEDAG